jgi:hypothetical protein
MSNIIIKANIVAVNQNYDYAYCEIPSQVYIDCSIAILKGGWFLEPQKCNNGLCFGKFSERQSGNSIQIVEVIQDGINYYLNGELLDYISKQNECCGATPELTPLEITPFTPCYDVCPDVDGNYVFSVLLPKMYSIFVNQTFSLSGTFNGIPGDPVMFDGLEDEVDAVTEASSVWDSYGAWTLVGQTLVLTSKFVTCANIKAVGDIQLWCLPSTFPIEFDTITRDDGNGGLRTIVLPSAITCQDNAALVAALTSPVNYFADGELTTPIADKVQYTGTGVPIKIKLGAVVKASWVRGVCE